MPATDVTYLRGLPDRRGSGGGEDAVPQLVEVIVPDGGTAEIDVPGTPVSRVGAGNHRIAGTIDPGNPAEE